MECWMRLLKIELTSTQMQETIVIGDNKQENERRYNYGIVSSTIGDNLSIKVQGTKYPAINKDKGTLTIINLDYETILRIKLGQYYKIKIWCGYKSWNKEPFLLYSGEISHMSTKIYSHHETETYIIFASTIVAKYSQKRMNLSLNSGLNVYAMMSYVLNTNGASKYHLDPKLKEKAINEYKALNGTLTTVLDSYTLTLGGEYSVACDGTEGTVIDVTSTKGKRFIKLDPSAIPMKSGNPTVTSEGLRMELLPICNLKVGDILVIDPALINIAIENAESVTSTFNANYMDSNGCYMIIELGFSLENRGQNFGYQIKARALDILYNLTGISGK